MTKLQIYGSSPFLPTQSQKGSRLERLALSVTICLVFLFCAAAAITSSAQSLTTLASFDGADGAFPVAPVIQGTDGNFYGTTPNGGANEDGMVFKITPSGRLTTLYSFCTVPEWCPDGANPSAALVEGTDGNFYGTTTHGGGGICCDTDGTIFKITPGGDLTTLHNFPSFPDDGYLPSSALVQAGDGNFYGTTEIGGAHGDGTVFRLVTLRPCIVCPSLE